FNFGRIATHITKLILDENMDPVVAVGIDVQLKHRTAEYAPDGNMHANYIRFLSEELVPYIEGKYGVRSNPSDRILAGDSLGGTVSLHLALQNPGQFPNVISLSGAYLAP